MSADNRLEREIVTPENVKKWIRELHASAPSGQNGSNGASMAHMPDQLDQHEYRHQPRTEGSMALADPDRLPSPQKPQYPQRDAIPFPVDRAPKPAAAGGAGVGYSGARRGLLKAVGYSVLAALGVGGVAAAVAISRGGSEANNDNSSAGGAGNPLTAEPSKEPTNDPTQQVLPSQEPSLEPSKEPTNDPTEWATPTTENMNSYLFHAVENKQKYFTAIDSNGVEVIVDVPQEAEVIKDIESGKAVWNEGLRGYAKMDGETTLIWRAGPTGWSDGNWLLVIDQLDLSEYGLGVLSVETDLDNSENAYPLNEDVKEKIVSILSDKWGNRSQMTQLEIGDFYRLENTTPKEENLSRSGGVTFYVDHGYKAGEVVGQNNSGQKEYTWRNYSQSGRAVLSMDFPFNDKNTPDTRKGSMSMHFLSLINWVLNQPTSTQIVNLLNKPSSLPIYANPTSQDLETLFGEENYSLFSKFFDNFGQTSSSSQLSPKLFK